MDKLKFHVIAYGGCDMLKIRRCTKKKKNTDNIGMALHRCYTNKVPFLRISQYLVHFSYRFNKKSQGYIRTHYPHLYSPKNASPK